MFYVWDESIWTITGTKVTSTGETVLYSRREDGQHHGITIILRKGIEHSLLEYKPVSNRLIEARGRFTQTSP